MIINILTTRDEHPFSLYGHDYQCGISIDYSIQSKIPNHELEVSDRILTPEQEMMVFKSSYIFKYRTFMQVAGFEDDPQEINLYLSNDVYMFQTSPDVQEATHFCVFDPVYVCFKTEADLIAFKLKYQQTD